MKHGSETAFVTGGGSGIGLSIAKALARRGWKIAICGRDGEKIEQAGRQLASLSSASGGGPRGVFAARADVSIEADVKSWIAQARERLGPPGLLVNNAGIGSWGEITSLSQEDWAHVLDVNIKGAFLCTREVLPLMRENGGGYVINVASLAGKKGMAGASAYCASKFALIGFTESLLVEQKKHNIRATAICPGYVATPLASGSDVPASEMIQPEDVAATVLYLMDLAPMVVIREVVMERIGAI